MANKKESRIKPRTKRVLQRQAFIDNLRQKMTPYEMALSAHSISLNTLARQLAEELRATETKPFKSRGESIEYSRPLIAWNIRQRAREDAQKLLGLYPAEEHRITANVSETMSEEDKDLLRNVAREVAEKIRRKK